MGWTILSILFFALQVLAQTGAVVTETMRIEIDNRTHIARKINGRWWSEDNRELSQTNVGYGTSAAATPVIWCGSTTTARWTLLRSTTLIALWGLTR